jgi:hypothetical protein
VKTSFPRLGWRDPVAACILIVAGGASLALVPVDSPGIAVRSEPEPRPTVAAKRAAQQQQQAPAPASTKPSAAATRTLLAEQKDAAASRVAQPQPANPVEASPPPVEELSPRDVQELLGGYRRHFEKGSIKLDLDLGGTSAADIQRLAAGWVLQGNGSSVLVNLDGSAQRIATPASKSELWFPVPTELLPTTVQAAADHWFGSDNRAEVWLVIGAVQTLQLFRTVAERQVSEHGVVLLRVAKDANAAGASIEIVRCSTAARGKP